MKRLLVRGGAIAAVFVAVVATLSCGLFDGQVSLSLTDSPVLAADVAKAVVTIREIQYTRGADDTWETLRVFDPPEAFDLLALQGGVVAPLANVAIGAGHVGQIRFVLDAEEATTSTAAPDTPGCYIELADTTRLPLFVPSGTRSGFKATGAFDVPLNGSVAITADFDVRKSLVRRPGQDSFILKPTIRLVVDDEAGSIVVQLANAELFDTLAVYAYADGTYAETEALVPVAETDVPQFAGAVTSAALCDDGNYRLAFLAAGTYDLVVAAYQLDGTFAEVAAIHQDAVVTSGGNTQVSIDLAL